MKLIGQAGLVLLAAIICWVDLDQIYGSEREIAAGVIWKVKPYYWKDKNNQSKGIIAETFQYIKEGCIANSTLFSNLEETAMLGSLREFYDTFKDADKHPYGENSLAGVTGLTARWLPVIQEFDKQILDNRSMTEKTLFTEPHSSVVVHRRRISLFFKLKKGIWKTRHILVLSFLSAIIFAILVWFAERWNNPEFGKSFTFGFGTGLWWAFVTMTTVGYGDVVPRSFVGRFLTIIWMILGLAAASLMTAAVSDVVLGVDYIDLTTYKVAVIRDSYEANAIVRDYNSTLHECDSYEEVLKAVSNEEAEAGVLPSFVAGSMMAELYYELELRVPFQLDLKVPVKMLYNPRLFHNNTEYVQCANTYFAVIFEMYIRKYKEFVQEETLYVESIGEFYQSNDIIKYSTITIAALVGIGLLYDLFYGFLIFQKRRDQRGKDNNAVLQNKFNNNNHLPNNNKVENGAWRNDELNKMRQDIMGIKENITKINTLAKYKNPWY